MLKKELIDNYAFYFIDDIKNPFIQLLSIGHEIRNTKEYYFDNRERKHAYLFQYTLSGSGTLILNQEKHIIDKDKGFLLRFPSDTAYYFDKQTNSDWEFMYIVFKGEEVERYYDYIVSKHGNIFSQSEFHPIIHKMKTLFEEIKTQQLSDPFTVSSKTFELLCLLCNINQNQIGSTVEKAKEYMQSHFDEGIGIAEVSTYLNISQSHLSRQFIHETGQKPIDYLTKIRIEQSVELLVNTEKSIDEIAQLCGFSCGNYFNKVFKKYIHISPNRFRLNAKSKGYSRVQV